MTPYQRSVIAEVYAHYGPGCACCGETRRTFLQLDHTMSKQEVHDVGYPKPLWDQHGGFPFCWNLRKYGFPPIVQVLCANCHQEKSRAGRNDQHARCSCQD